MSEEILHVTDDTFEEHVLKSSSPVLVDYWAEWCGPCKMIAPVLARIATDYKGKVVIAKLNIDENPSAPQRYGVRGIPTLMLFKDGEVEATKVESSVLGKTKLPRTEDSTFAQVWASCAAENGYPR